MFWFHHLRNALQHVNSVVQLTHYNWYYNVIEVLSFCREEFMCYCFINLCASFAYVYGFLKGFAQCMRLCARCRGYVYEYVFARRADYCVRIQLVRSKQLMRTNMSLRVKRPIAYIYNVCALSGLCVRISLCA